MSVDLVAFWEPRASKPKLKEVSRADLVDHSELLRLREGDYAESHVRVIRVQRSKATHIQSH